MVLVDEFKAYLIEADNIFDLIGNCFGMLCNNISNHQAFISAYFGEESEEKCNPNIRILNEFSEKIMDELLMYEASQYNRVIDKIFELIDNVELRDFLDPKENQLTIIYCILVAIDAVAINWDIKRLSGIMGPLDRQQKTRYRVYFNMKKTLHSSYVENVGRERVSASTFNELFENFRFIDETKWKENIDVPQVKFVPSVNNRGEKQENSFTLRIGMFPVSNRKNFQFVSTVGSGLKVDYSQSEQKKFINTILRAMEKAIQKECKVIVFPEYVVSPELYKVIKNKIREYALTKGADKNPYLVFAGTTWTDDNNNVMKILDSWGEEIGEYYKYSPFTKKKNSRNKFRQCEDLGNPGKKCDVFAVEGVGTFLPAICRDVIDGEYTEEIVKMLLPLFVIISSWSPSVASFEQRQKEFANKYFTSSILANACSSVVQSTIKIGNGGIIHKENTIAGLELSPICRDDCEGTCENEGCLFILDYDFSYTEGNNTKISVEKI